MWNTARRIAALAFLVVVVSVGAASAQYGAPTAPSTPAVPPSPSAPSPAPSTDAPGGAGMYPYMVNVAFATFGTGERVILTDAQGMTLYYLRNETSSATMCTGRCTTIWHPALAAGATTTDPALSSVTVVNNVNGPQLTYHGHLLYTFFKDTAPGQVNGDGVVDTWGVWAAATPALYFQP